MMFSLVHTGKLEQESRNVLNLGYVTKNWWLYSSLIVFQSPSCWIEQGSSNWHWLCRDSSELVAKNESSERYQWRAKNEINTGLQYASRGISSSQNNFQTHPSSVLRDQNCMVFCTPGENPVGAPYSANIRGTFQSGIFAYHIQI